MRIWEEELIRHRFVARTEQFALGVANLVAMDTALDNLLRVVQLWPVLVPKRWEFLRRRHIGSGAFLAGECCHILRVLTVQRKRSLERLGQSFDRHVAEPRRAMRARAESTVNGPVRI